MLRLRQVLRAPCAQRWRASCRRRVGTEATSKAATELSSAVAASPALETAASAAAKLTSPAKIDPLILAQASYALRHEVGLHVEGCAGIWLSGSHVLGPVVSWLRLLARPLNMLGIGKTFGTKRIELMATRVEAVLQKNNIPVQAVLPRIKESGLIVYVDPALAERALAICNAESRQLGTLLLRPTPHRILGMPFVEDVLTGNPSALVRVLLPKDPGFGGKEALFMLFRPYGRIVKLELDGAGLVGTVRYASARSAIAARVCLHRTYGGALQIEFVPLSYVAKLLSVMQTPRLIPIFALVLSLVVSVTGVMLVEPLRLFNVAQRVTLSTVHARRDALESEEADMLSELGRAHAVRVMRERDVFRALHDTLSARPNGVAIVYADAGAGRGLMIDQVLRGRYGVIRIDCLSGHVFGAAGGESSFVDDLEAAIGYVPSFQTLNTLLRSLESLVVSKDARSSVTPLQSHLEEVLTTLRSALKLIASPAMLTSQSFYPVVVFQGFDELIDRIAQKSPGTADILRDGLLRWAIDVSESHVAHIVFLGDSAFVDRVIDQLNSLRGSTRCFCLADLESERAHSFLAEALAVLQAREGGPLPSQGSDEEGALSRLSLWQFVRSWYNITASSLTRSLFAKRGEAGGAAAADANSSATPGDDMGRTSVDGELGAALVRAVHLLGGRLMDLNVLVLRLEQLMAPDTVGAAAIHSCLDAMTRDARTRVLQTGFGGHVTTNSTGRPWTALQLWATMQRIVRATGRGEHCTYGDLLENVFDGQAGPLEALIQSRLIALGPIGDSADDRPVGPGSPIYGHVFVRLVSDARLRARINKITARTAIAKLRGQLTDIENALQHIDEAAFPGWVVRARRAALHAEWESKSAQLTKMEAQLKILEANQVKLELANNE